MAAAQSFTELVPDTCTDVQKSYEKCACNHISRCTFVREVKPWYIFIKSMQRNNRGGALLIRTQLRELQNWNASSRRKPLLLLGARQVGKTWLLQEFGRKEFDSVAAISFDENPTARAIFDHGYNAQDLLKGIQLETGVRVIPGKTLVVFDEVQECPKALTSLKYFCEQIPDLAVAAAGSLLGVAAHEGTGFPVGKVNILHLHPLSFREFLQAAGREDFSELIDSGDVRLMNDFASRLTECLKDYYFVGGMPEAVAAFVADHDYALVRAIQQEILTGYRLDMSKHIEPRRLEPVLAVFKAIPSQLSKENKRLVYGQVREGGRARDFEFALTWLENAGITVVVPRISKAYVPLNGYTDPGQRRAYKVFLSDVGLLGAMAKLPARAVLEKDAFFGQYKGALTEQYVCQQLISECGLTPFYWTARNGTAEIDFVVQDDEKVIGLEVKSAENLQAKSLRVFHNTYPGTAAVRFSLAPYRREDWMVNVPLYAIQNMGLWARQRADDAS